MYKLIRLPEYFISSKSAGDDFILRKSKVIVYAVMYTIVLICAILILNFCAHIEYIPNLSLGIIFGFAALFVLKITGNLILVGNLMALFWTIIIGSMVPQTGGLYSDNLLWLIIAPLISLLFSNKKSGLLWFFALLAYTIWLYKYGGSVNKFVPLEHSYYLISYVFLFISIFSIVLIFEHGQTLIIKMLNNQKQALQSQKQELEQKNQEILAQKVQLEKMGVKLKETNYALEHFAATAAHDLREPLRMISMYTGLAQRRMSNIPDARRDEYMKFATDGAARMSVLLDSLLSFSRSGKQVEDLKTVDLNTTLYNVILNLTVVLKETGASVTATQLPILTASESDMSQLLQNLIANAIKFRKENIISEVEIGYIERKNNHVITVKDNGIGIKKEHQSKVFAIFQRLNGRDKYDGSGIGLATCRKIVESLDGKIWLRSIEGEGTTFYIAIPKSVAIAAINEEEFAHA
jgi:signal transduction histidine kinase